MSPLEFPEVAGQGGSDIAYFHIERGWVRVG